MKKSIIITLLLFVVINGFEQNHYPILSDGNLITNGDSVKFGGTSFISKTVTLYSFKPDTVKSILMCADTSFIKGLESWILKPVPDSNDLYFPNRIPYMFWIFGYAIYPLNRFVSYLDENKKPLKKYLVVFLSIKR